MISFVPAFLAILLATLLPAYAGLFALMISVGRRPRTLFLSAFSVGIFLWYFSDTIGDSSYLGVNQGLSGGIGHLGLVLLFIVGLGFFLAMDRRGMLTSTFESNNKGAASTASSLLLPILVAVALSVHGFGEGSDFGATASSGVGASIILTFGGYGPAISYMLHKILEATMVGSGYFIYFAWQDGIVKARHGDLILLGSIFSVPTMIGTAISYYFPFNTTYIYALGAGASVYVILKLVAPLSQGAAASHGEWLKIGFLVLLGFVLLYVAALLHSVALM